MVCLNALFPAVLPLDGVADIDLAPYSGGLRDSIRFSVFEHLMGNDLSDVQQQQAMQMRLLCWCDIPGYAQAWKALVQYSEETRKLEELCLAALNLIEQQDSTASCIGDFLDSPWIIFSDSSKSPVTASTPVTASSQGSPDTSTFTDASTVSLHQSCLGAGVSNVPPVPNPLLRGMPGREISPAKTDGAAFSGDISAAPVLTYPQNLSRTEFHQHPLARDLAMSSREKAQLGLIIPKQVSSRQF